MVCTHGSVHGSVHESVHGSVSRHESNSTRMSQSQNHRPIRCMLLQKTLTDGEFDCELWLARVKLSKRVRHRRTGDTMTQKWGDRRHKHMLKYTDPRPDRQQAELCEKAHRPTARQKADRTLRASSVSSRPRPRICECAPIRSTFITSRTSSIFTSAAAAAAIFCGPPARVNLERRVACHRHSLMSYHIRPSTLLHTRIRTFAESRWRHSLRKRKTTRVPGAAHFNPWFDAPTISSYIPFLFCQASTPATMWTSIRLNE